MGKQNVETRSVRRVTEDRVWDSLREVHRAMSQYTLVAGIITPAMRDRELLANVQKNGDLESLMRHAEMLANDVPRFRDSLAAIFASHSQRRGSSSANDDPMRSIQIFERYQEWGTSYERVVIPVVLEIAEIFNRAGHYVGLDNYKRGSISETFRALAASQQAQEQQS